MAAKNSSIDKMILRIAVSINKLLYNYINFSVFSERANFSPVRVRREFFYQLPMALLSILDNSNRLGSVTLEIQTMGRKLRNS